MTDFTPSQFPDDLDGQKRFIANHPRLNDKERTHLSLYVDMRGLSGALSGIDQMLAEERPERVEKMRTQIKRFGWVGALIYTITHFKLPPKDYQQRMDDAAEELVKTQDQPLQEAGTEIRGRVSHLVRRIEASTFDKGHTDFGPEAKAIWNRLGGRRETFPRYQLDTPPAPAKSLGPG